VARWAEPVDRTRPWTVLSSVHDLASAAAGMPVIVVDVVARRVTARG
jgi:hypothetical protein